MAPKAEAAIIHLAADAIVQWGMARREPLEALAGATILAIAGIGDPRAFEAQLRATSARIAMRAFRDHYPFGPGDAARLAREAEGTNYAVCTLKDAVKLAPFWPPSAPPLWYLSQRVSIELGAEALHALARRLARPAT
jgi:tetraacyldisaccharide 4'-kinase